MKRLCLLAVAAVAVLVGSGGQAAQAQGVHLGIGGVHIDVGRPHSGYYGRQSYYRGGGYYQRSGYGGGWGARQGHGGWHDTGHYDYHPESYRRHYNHYHYTPGHYDYHGSGHWDRRR